MAIDQIKTINELERLPQVEDSNAFAASTGGATGSVTANQIMEYLKQYLESLSNKSTTITQSNDQYPTCNAVSSEITRITNIMNNSTGITSGYYKFPSGLILQWGRYTGGDDARVTINFGISFPNTPIAVVKSDNFYYDNLAQWHYTNTYSITNSSFQTYASRQRVDGHGFSWVAMGH